MGSVELLSDNDTSETAIRFGQISDIQALRKRGRRSAKSERKIEETINR